MHDVMLSQLNYVASAWLNSGVRAERQPRSSHPFIVPAQVFETRRGWLVVFISHDQFWQRFCTEIGRKDWIEDARFATMAARQINRVAAIEAIGKELARDDAEHWVERLVPLGVVAAAVATLEDALASELVANRHMIVEIETPGGTLRSVGNPIKVSGATPVYFAASPFG